MNDEAFRSWLTGLADGEGCFYIAPKTRASGNKTYVPAFILSLRDDDRPVLEMIVERTGIGRLHRVTSGRGKSKPLVRWEVHTQAECCALVEHFDRFPLQTKKARDYEVWREAVEVWITIAPGNRWKGQTDYSPIARLKERLAEVRAYVPPD
jgi:hypothetical protein